MAEEGSTARRAYAKLCLEMRHLRLVGAREELAETEQSLRESLEAMTKQVQRLTWAEQQVRSLREEMDEAQRRLSQEYLRLCQLPLVREVAAKDGLVQVTTAATHIKHQEKPYRIGRLKLLVDPNGYLTVENLAQPVFLDGKRYDHPYVVDGKMRPEEVSGVAAGMICRGSFSELVEWLGQYLGDYDAQRAYCPVEAWPVADLASHDFGEEAELPPKREIAAQRLFVQACLKPWQARLAESERAVAEAERSYEGLYNEIHIQQRRIEEIKERLSQLEVGADGEQRYEEEYDVLCQLPGVREVRVKQGVIQLFTDAICSLLWVCWVPGIREVRAKQGVIQLFTETIYITHGGRRRRIGDFRMDLRVGRGVRIHKLENPLRTLYWACHPHPHIRDARPCFGNVEKRISREMGSCNFKDVVLLCLEFLQTYNPQSAYLDISAW